MPQGTDILAGHDGTVSLAGEAGGYGLCVVLDGETNGGSTFDDQYGHCSQLLVSAGQTVKAGDLIAKVGSTETLRDRTFISGSAVDGEYLNPLYFCGYGDFSERHFCRRPDMQAEAETIFITISHPEKPV